MSNEQKRIFTDRAEGESLTLAGAEWVYRIWDHGGEDDISRHSHRDGTNGQIRHVKRDGEGFVWEFSWILHDDREDKDSPYIVSRYSGAADSLEKAAQQALDYQPQILEIAGMHWYPNGENRWLASAHTGEARIRLYGECYVWELDFPALARLAGVEIWGNELKGRAATLEEAVHAIVEAPRMFMASLYSVLPDAQTAEAFEAGKAAGRAEARLKILEVLA